MDVLPPVEVGAVDEAQAIRRDARLRGPLSHGALDDTLGLLQRRCCGATTLKGLWPTSMARQSLWQMIRLRGQWLEALRGPWSVLPMKTALPCLTKMSTATAVS